MVHLVEGDILLSYAHAIAHGVAPADDFKSGLAFALREAWPAMYNDFRHYCHTYHPKPGGLWTWSGVGDTHLIALFTQEPSPDPHSHGHPGRARLEYVNHSLRELRQVVQDEGYTSLAIPRLATGVGRLDWTEVFPLIIHHLGELPIPVYVYHSYRKGVKAEEAGVRERELAL